MSYQVNINKKSVKLSVIVAWILSISLLQGCQLTRSHIGTGLGATTSTVACVSMGIDNPYVIAMCSLGGALAGAEMMYQSDYDVHYGTFVDHMNVATSGSSYTNWYNQRTGNSGIIHTTSLYYKGPIKCVDYDVTVDITNPWPVIGMGLSLIHI